MDANVLYLWMKKQAFLHDLGIILSAKRGSSCPLSYIFISREGIYM